MNHEHIALSAGEVSALWSQYLNNDLSKATLSYLRATADDPDIKSIVQYALELSRTQNEEIAVIFKKAGGITPDGFSKDDVDTGAARMFSDIFALHYIKQMTRLGLPSYALSLEVAARDDILDFYKRCLKNEIDLNDKVTQVLLAKGLYIRPPFVNPPTQISFVKSPGFMGSLFGSKRGLTAQEITHIFLNMQSNSLGRALELGFIHSASSPEIKDYFIRGSEICKKHIKVFHDLLADSDLPSPVSWDSEVVNTNSRPFSDKFMLLHILIIAVSGLGNYGLSLSLSQRADLVSTYTQFAAEVAQYAEDGSNMMIERGWMIEPPMAVIHKELELSR